MQPGPGKGAWLSRLVTFDFLAATKQVRSNIPHLRVCVGPGESTRVLYYAMEAALVDLSYSYKQKCVV